MIVVSLSRVLWASTLALAATEHCEPHCPVGLLGERHRFFYTANTSRREREAGCEKLPRRVVQTFKIGAANEQQCAENPVANLHPTVKPIDLMRWLVRLLNPTGGLVLDPFAGSGTTGIAAVLEQARFLGIERDGVYVPVARARITHWSKQAASRRPSSRRPSCAGADRRPAPTTR